MTTHEQELVAGGAIAGGMIGFMMTISFIFYILVVIACWKIFTKAGIEGWKALIPVYNMYLLYKIASVNFWVWSFLPIIAAAVLSAFMPQSTTATPTPEISPILLIIFLVVLVWAIVGAWKMSKGLATAFAKGTGFALGLFFLTSIFQLILGFGSAKYVGQKLE